MSLKEVEREIPLSGQQLFDHSAVLKSEIEKFHENFVLNERFKEFDGLIRKNHRIYEANDLLPHLSVGRLNSLVVSLEKLDELLKRVVEGRFSNEELNQLDLGNLSQMEIVRIAESKLRDLTPVHHLDSIPEAETSDREQLNS